MTIALLPHADSYVATVLYAAAVALALVGLVVVDVVRYQRRRARQRRAARLEDRDPSLEG